MPQDRLDAAAKRDPAAAKYSEKTTYVNKAPASSTTLPPELQTAVPSCAQSCLARYIAQEYNCSEDDTDCLCSQYSTEGYTLGELAYICLEQNCRNASSAQSSSLYSVCQAVRGAVPATHSVLTVPATTISSYAPYASSTPAAPVVQSTSAGQTQTRSLSPSRPASSSPATVSTAATASAVPAMGLSSSRSSSTPAGAAAAAASTSKSLSSTGLTGGQAAGVSIAAMGAVMAGIALIYLIICFRRRRVTQRDDRKSYDFVDEAPPRFSPFNYGYADPRGPLGGFHGKRVELMTDKNRNSEWHRQHYRYPEATGPVRRYEKSVEISPDSRRSNDSTMTVSHLLPEKREPGSSSRQLPKSPAPSAFTGRTVFEEDRSPAIPSPKLLPPVPNLPLPSHSKALYYPPSRRLQPRIQNQRPPPPPRPPPPRKPLPPNFKEEYALSQESVRHPSLSLDIPRQAARLSRIPSPVAFPMPPTMPKPDSRPSSENRKSQNTSRSRSRVSSTSLLNYYASPEANNNSSSTSISAEAAEQEEEEGRVDIDSPTPIEDQAQKRKPVPKTIAVQKPGYPPTQAIRQSAASDTSFESDGPDEPTPPLAELGREIERALTPVAESPIRNASASPIAGIRYPKVPRSSNQSVPRSPHPGKLSPLRPPAPVMGKPAPISGKPASPRTPPAPRSNRKEPDPPPKTLKTFADYTRTISPQSPPTPRPHPLVPPPPRPPPQHHQPPPPPPQHNPPDTTPSLVRRNTASSSHSGASTLAAKRRGNTYAQDLERSLHLTDPMTTHSRNASHQTLHTTRSDPPISSGSSLPRSGGSPLRGHGAQIAHSNNRGGGPGSGGGAGGSGEAGLWQSPTKSTFPGEAQTVAMKSPLWEPKLTPSRRGEDLYLSVGVATPMTAAFTPQSERFGRAR